MRFTILFLFISFNLFGQFKLDVAGNARITGRLDLMSEGGSKFSDTWNTFIGLYAGGSNTTGISNSFFGNSTGVYNTTGSFNSFFGNKVGVSNTTGSSNSFFGNNAGYWNTTGYSNSFFGTEAGTRNSKGYSNSFFGNNAGRDNDTGSFNSFFGNYAGFFNSSGIFRTGIGESANSLNNYSNSTGLGSNADPTAANQVRIGDSGVTSISGQVPFSATSDARFKTQISRENIPGIEFIKKLSPVTYYFDTKKFEDWKYAQYGERDTANWEGKYDIEKILQTGFIAQEVEEAANSMGFDFSGVDKPASEKSYYGLRYATFVVPLVKAVQEQQTQIENQDKLIEQQQNKIASLEKEVTRINQQDERIAELETLINQLLANQDNKQNGQHLNVVLAQKPTLEQNVPNPFDGTTRIDYFIPESHSDKAILIITSVDGKEIQKVKIQGHGEGSLSIKMDRLSKGTYFYSLLVDGKMVETKRMIYTE